MASRAKRKRQRRPNVASLAGARAARTQLDVVRGINALITAIADGAPIEERTISEVRVIKGFFPPKDRRAVRPGLTLQQVLGRPLIEA